MDSFIEGLYNAIYFIINQFLSIVLLPINQLLEPLLAGVLTSEQLLSFYGILNTYILPTCAFFVHLVPPFTWQAIVIFISFYASLFSVVFAVHWVLKILKLAKRIIPFV